MTDLLRGVADAIDPMPPWGDDVRERSLSDRDRDILAFARKFIEAHGYSPNVREIGEAVGLSSSSTVHAHLSALRCKGFVDFRDRSPRTLRVLL